MSKSKVFVVGLDGATWKNLQPLIKAGNLPFISSLKNQSAWGTLLSTTPPLTAPAWASFQTGVNPGKHGIFGFVNYRHPRGPTVFSSTDFKVSPLRSFLSRQNIRSLIINLPLSYPVSPHKGILISSFLTPPGKQFAFPRKIEKRLKQLNYQIDILIEKKYGDLPHKQLKESTKNKLLKKLIKLAQNRATTFKALSPKQAFSYFFLLFKETDVAQHLFWQDQRLSRFYQELDKILSQLYSFFCQEFSGKLHFMLISDHGFHSTAKLQFAPLFWLKSAKFITITKKPKTKLWNAASLLNQRLKKHGLSLSEVIGINHLRQKLVKSAEEEASHNLIQQLGLSVTAEGLYFYPPKANFLLKQKSKIIQGLKSVKYQKKKVFSLVAASDQIYSGNQVKQAPDIVWLVNEEFAINASPLASKTISPRFTQLQGDHIADREGIYLINSPLVKPGPNRKLAIIDLFPLISSLLGAGLPNYLDGQVPLSLFKTKKTVRIKSHRQIISNIINHQIKQLGKK